MEIWKGLRKHLKDDKKIAIITLYYNSVNYGGLLQAYALQKVTEVLAQVKTLQIPLIISKNDPIKRVQIKQLTSSLIRHLKERTLIERLKRDKNSEEENKKINNSLDARNQIISDFRNQIPHFDIIDEEDIIIEKFRNLDLFICGSDQIWNPDWYDSAYFLDFVYDDKPKIAYAASIGKSHLTPEQIDFMKPLINRLDYISVRENEAKDLTQPFVEKEVKVVLDPTLLLTKDEWNEIAKDISINEPYIFVYFLGNSTKNRRLIKKASQILGYKIAAIHHVHLRYEKADSGFADIECNDVGPAEFVGLIKNAEMVITDSFHGCVFSIIYQKKFWAVKRHQDNEKGSMNSRLYSLFENLKVGDRILKEDDIKKTKLLETIDYTVVQEALEEKKKESLDFLEEALGVK